MDSTHSPSFRGDNTRGSTFNQGSVRAGGNLHLGNLNSFIGGDKEKDPYKECLRQLLSTLHGDPRDRKENLITLNGRWLKGICQWIIHTKEFVQWNKSKPPRLLWITGGPGKGKTMLAHFLVNYCEVMGANEPDRQRVIYFFCGAQDGLNSGPSLLRGLVSQMLIKNETTFRHIQEPFSNHGKSLFDDDRFEALWRVFNSMIRDETTLTSVTCILDGLDECIEESLGADVNHRDNHGQTALHYVSNRVLDPIIDSDEAIEISRLLLSKMSGAAIVAPDNDGLSAYDNALEADQRKRKQLEHIQGNAFLRSRYDLVRKVHALENSGMIRKKKTSALKLIGSAFEAIKAEVMNPDQEEVFINHHRNLGDEGSLEKALRIVRWRREYREAVEEQA